MKSAGGSVNQRVYIDMNDYLENSQVEGEVNNTQPNITAPEVKKLQIIQIIPMVVHFGNMECLNYS